MTAAIISLAIAFSVVLGCELVRKFSPKPVYPQPSFSQLSPQAETQFYFSQSLQLMFDGKNKEAQELMKKALALDPDSAYLHFKLAQIHAISSDFDPALEQARLALNLSPDWKEPYFFLIELYMTEKKPELAEPIAEKLIEIAPEDPIAHRELSRIYEVQGLSRSAVVVLKNYLDQYPDQIYLKKEYARLLIRIGRPEESEKAYQELLESAPGDAEAWAEYAGLEVSRPNFPEAIRAYQEELNLEPANLQDRLELVKILLKQGQRQEADDQLEMAKRTNPQTPEPWLFSAYLHLQDKDLVKAREEYLQVLQLDPKSEPAPYNLGLIEMDSKNWDEAEKWFSRIPADSNLYPDAQAQIIWLKYQQGKKEEAVSQAKDLTAKHPGKKTFWLILIEIYQKEEQYQQAVQTLEEALNHIPQDPDLFYSLAVVYSLQGDPEKALEFAQLALNKKPDDPALLNFIGYTWVDARINLDQAEAYLKKALAKEPENGAIIDSIGWLYFQKGQSREALKWIRRAEEKIPEDPEILKHLGQIYLKLGDKKKARESLEKALAHHPNSALKKQIENLLDETKP